MESSKVSFRSHVKIEEQLPENQLELTDLQFDSVLTTSAETLVLCSDRWCLMQNTPKLTMLFSRFYRHFGLLLWTNFFHHEVHWKFKQISLNRWVSWKLNSCWGEWSSYWYRICNAIILYKCEVLIPCGTPKLEYTNSLTINENWF